MTAERKGEIQVFKLIAAIFLPLAAGGFSAFLTANDMKLYGAFGRPALSPPGWLFPIVWTILYIAMGIASYMVYTSEAEPTKKEKALRLYTTQLAMNFFWSTLFFTYTRYLVSLIWLLVMWAVILVCTIRFYRIRKAAGFMMFGLFLWTTFAAYLNLAFYIQSITAVAFTV